MRPPEFWKADVKGRDGAWTLRALLTPLSWAYAFAAAHRIRTTISRHAPVPVICIGNLTVDAGITCNGGNANDIGITLPAAVALDATAGGAAPRLRGFFAGGPPLAPVGGGRFRRPPPTPPPAAPAPRPASSRTKPGRHTRS